MQVDVAIIGAGTAGLTAYRAARTEGATAMVIESGAYGTSCARLACMPSKLLIAAADAAHAVAMAPGFGVHPQGRQSIDGRAVMARVRRERDRFVGFVLRDVDSIPDHDRIRGHARFVDDHTILVDGKRVVARAVVIATGSRPARMEGCAELGERLVVSDDIFEWHDLPNSVAVIGAGIIGLELGQALHRLGVQVAIFGRGGHLGPINDPAVLACAAATFNQELLLDPEAGIEVLHRDGEHVAIHRTQSDGAKVVEHFDYVLAATGRLANVQDIGLEHTSVRLDAKGIPVHDAATAQTAIADATSGTGSPIFIAGDASNFIPLLHEATDEGRIAGRNAARLALGRPVQAGLRRAPLSVVFTDPQIGIVGGGFRAQQADGFVAGQASFEDQGRARILMRNKGMLSVYAATASGLFSGAELFAPAGEHLAHLLAWALQNRMSIEQMIEMPFYHPVLEEGLRTALQDANTNLHLARGAEFVST